MLLLEYSGTECTVSDLYPEKIAASYDPLLSDNYGVPVPPLDRNGYILEIWNTFWSDESFPERRKQAGLGRLTPAGWY